MNIASVYPSYGKEHDIKSLQRCWCKPTVEVVNDVDGSYGAIIMHRDELSVKLNCHGYYHGTTRWPIGEQVNEGPVR